jgi:predicted regulator of Ras-like GTPase activity (Roadblock/LC7/MglB family)
VDVAQALADLTEISSQIEAAVVFDAHGTVQGSTLADETAAKALADAAALLLERADQVRSGEAAVTQVEAALADGCVFVVRDGERRIAATTAASPTVGLVFYDLKSALRDSAAEEAAAAAPKPKPKPKPKPAPKQASDEA